MQVPFHLRRLAQSAPASALLLLSHDRADLARLCARLRLDPLPPMFTVADGVVLVLPRPTTEAFGGVLRLRALADNLFVPVDADLLPTLLPDEAREIVHRRGLVFLPGERVLEFNPDLPMPLSALLAVGRVRRDPWNPLPQPDPLAERLTEITLAVPEVPPDDLLTAGGDDIGADDPDADAAGLPARALGKTAFGAGKALAWLGSMLGLKGLARTGANWMAAGLGMAPQLAASVLGQQNANLRRLLQAFRDGKIDEALRRALPLGDGERGAAPATGAGLPLHNLLYSLKNILGDGAQGGIWFTEPDLWHELTLEYRRQAALATERGDYRRAAFIYGKLLRDYRAAAAVLARGGLHRDAAILYLKRLNDPLSAAREYEAAGEIDRALALYRNLGDHLLAGDLLRRAGEEEQALAEYERAAQQLLAARGDHYEAGEIMRNRARRMDLAFPYYQKGWELRPQGSPVPCALRLAQAHAHNEVAEDLLTLATEADQYFAPPGNVHPAAEFFNELARLANGLGEANARDEVRDRALTSLAAKVRQQVMAGATPGALVSSAFGAGQAWPPATVSDAQFAVKHAAKRRGPSQSTPVVAGRVIFRAGVQSVTAICQAARSGYLFLGFESGEVICFRPHSNEVIFVGNQRIPILALAATQDGDAVVALTAESEGGTTLRSFVKRQTFEIIGAYKLSKAGEAEICSDLAGGSERFVVGVWSGSFLEFLEGPNLVVQGGVELRPDVDHQLRAVHLLPRGDKALVEWSVLALYDHWLVYWDIPNGPMPVSVAGAWTPDVSRNGALTRTVLSWLEKGAHSVELAGIDSAGCLHVSDIQLSAGKVTEVSTLAHPGREPFVAAAALGHNLYAAVTNNEVIWVRRGMNALLPIGRTDLAVPSPIACFAHHRGKEVIVVGSNGTVARVPLTAR